MHNLKDCCITWIEQAKELQETEKVKLDELVKEKGVPRYTLAVAYKQVSNLGNYCPSCGNLLNPELREQEPESVVVKKRVVPTSSQAPASPAPAEEKSLRTMCPICKGSGYMSGVKGEGAKCMKCVGKGFFGRDNTGRPISADRQEVASGLTARIEKENKPLREDAKPENWSKIK